MSVLNQLPATNLRWCDIRDTLNAHGGNVTNYIQDAFCDGSVTMDSPVPATHYGICETAAGTAEKAVTITGITSLTAGLLVHVKFLNANSASNPTLKINGLAAAAIVSSHLDTGYYYSFRYNGTSFVCCGFRSVTYTPDAKVNKWSPHKPYRSSVAEFSQVDFKSKMGGFLNIDDGIDTQTVAGGNAIGLLSEIQTKAQQYYTDLQNAGTIPVRNFEWAYGTPVYMNGNTPVFGVCRFGDFKNYKPSAKNIFLQQNETYDNPLAIDHYFDTEHWYYPINYIYGSELLNCIGASGNCLGSDYYGIIIVADSFSDSIYTIQSSGAAEKGSFPVLDLSDETFDDIDDDVMLIFLMSKTRIPTTHDTNFTELIADYPTTEFVMIDHPFIFAHIKNIVTSFTVWHFLGSASENWYFTDSEGISYPATGGFKFSASTGKILLEPDDNIKREILAGSIFPYKLTFTFSGSQQFGASAGTWTLFAYNRTWTTGQWYDDPEASNWVIVMIENELVEGEPCTDIRIYKQGAVSSSYVLNLSEGSYYAVSKIEVLNYNPNAQTHTPGDALYISINNGDKVINLSTIAGSQYEDLAMAAPPLFRFGNCVDLHSLGLAPTAPQFTDISLDSVLRN